MDFPSDIYQILEKLKDLHDHELTNVNVQRVTESIHLGFKYTSETLYDLCIDSAAELVTEHYEYSYFAARLWCYRLQSSLPAKFSDATFEMRTKGIQFNRGYMDFVTKHADVLDTMLCPMADLTSFDYFGVRTLAQSYLLKPPYEDVIAESDEQQTTDDTSMEEQGTNDAPMEEQETNDAPTEERTTNDEPMETPQQMFMRVAVALCSSRKDDHRDDEETLNAVRETYRMLSSKRYIHATPTLFHAGLENQTLASCYLVSIAEDSIESIFRSVTRCALVSKASGGVGLHVSNVRAAGALIKQTNGRSGGIVPMLTVFNQVARYVDQGGGKRKGAFTIYLEPWHADIEDFIRLSKKTGIEEKITRDLFTALWCCDLFMRRVIRNEEWSLMSPDLCPGLTDAWGKEFEKLYLDYESRKMYVKRIPAKHLWESLLRSQFETGMPFLMHKDHVNSRDNHSHVGVIKGSNLCTEITLYSDQNNIAVCNLASICLSKFVRDATNPDHACDCIEPTRFNDRLIVNRYDDGCTKCHGGYDYTALFETVCVATRNVDRTIDAMLYPLEETERSNKQNRPLGIGVQGFADVLSKLRLPWDSPRARLINKRIFETIYRATLTESSMLAVQYGAYENYPGSKVSRSILPHDAYDQWIEEFYSPDSNDDPAMKKRRRLVEEHRYVEPKDAKDDWLYQTINSGRGSGLLESWPELRLRLAHTGLRNSHRIAPMPTASTAQIFGNCESIEPRTSNMYYRRVLSGEFITMNHQLIDDMQALGMWDEPHKELLIRSRGSVQSMTDLPTELREVYRTVWEIPQRLLVDLTADRQPFIDQSQSFNLYLANPDFKRLTDAHFYAWQSGIKTGMYYLRTQAPVDPIQFTVPPVAIADQPSCLQRSSTIDNLKHARDSTNVFSMNSCTSEDNNEGCLSCQA